MFLNTLILKILKTVDSMEPVVLYSCILKYICDLYGYIKVKIFTKFFVVKVVFLEMFLSKYSPL